MSLNEQLAVEVCGWKELGGVYLHIHRPTTEWTWSDDYDAFYYPKVWWNPTTDLNQLQMCYEAAEKDNPIVFWAMYWAELKKLFASSLIEENARVATAWVKHPELVAQSILKAKEVS